MKKVLCDELCMMISKIGTGVAKLFYQMSPIF